MKFSLSQYVQMAALLQREAQQASIPDKRKRLAGLAEASRQLAHRASEQIAEERAEPERLVTDDVTYQRAPPISPMEPLTLRG
jgi:hypothetical protein